MEFLCGKRRVEKGKSNFGSIYQINSAGLHLPSLLNLNLTISFLLSLCVWLRATRMTFPFFFFGKEGGRSINFPDIFFIYFFRRKYFFLIRKDERRLRPGEITRRPPDWPNPTHVAKRIFPFLKNPFLPQIRHSPIFASRSPTTFVFLPYIRNEKKEFLTPFSLEKNEGKKGGGKYYIMNWSGREGKGGKKSFPDFFGHTQKNSPLQVTRSKMSAAASEN